MKETNNHFLFAIKTDVRGKDELTHIFSTAMSTLNLSSLLFLLFSILLSTVTRGIFKILHRIYYKSMLLLQRNNPDLPLLLIYYTKVFINVSVYGY